MYRPNMKLQLLMYRPNMNYIRKTDRRTAVSSCKTNFSCCVKTSTPCPSANPSAMTDQDSRRHVSSSDCCGYQRSTATTTRRVGPNDANISRAPTTACLVLFSVRTH